MKFTVEENERMIVENDLELPGFHYQRPCYLSTAHQTANGKLNNHNFSPSPASKPLIEKSCSSQFPCSRGEKKIVNA